MKTKELYNAPEMELIEIGFEQGILIASSDYGDEGKAGQNMTYNNYSEDF